MRELVKKKEHILSHILVVVIGHTLYQPFCITLYAKSDIDLRVKHAYPMVLHSML